MNAVFTTQIELDDRGVAWLCGTGTKVKEIVLDKIAHDGVRMRCMINTRICPWHRFTLL